MTTLSCGMPNDFTSSTQAIAAAPAPLQTSFAVRKPRATQASGRTLAVALASVLLLGIAIVWLQPDLLPSLCAAVMAGIGATFVMQGWLERRLGGYTGDNLGATQQLVELAALLGFLALLNVF